MTNTPKITAERTIAYERGWPTTRYAACVDGKSLNDKKGLERKFKTEEAAIKAGQLYVAQARA